MRTVSWWNGDCSSLCRLQWSSSLILIPSQWLWLWSDQHYLQRHFCSLFSKYWQKCHVLSRKSNNKTFLHILCCFIFSSSCSVRIPGVCDPQTSLPLNVLLITLPLTSLPVSVVINQYCIYSLSIDSEGRRHKFIIVIESLCLFPVLSLITITLSRRLTVKGTRIVFPFLLFPDSLGCILVFISISLPSSFQEVCLSIFVLLSSFPVIPAIYLLFSRFVLFSLGIHAVLYSMKRGIFISVSVSSMCFCRGNKDDNSRTKQRTALYMWQKQGSNLICYKLCSCGLCLPSSKSVETQWFSF